jgi:hypothetical protein
LSLFVPKTQYDSPRSHTKWITGIPSACSARLVSNEKPAFWLNPERRVEELKKMTGAASFLSRLLDIEFLKNRILWQFCLSTSSRLIRNLIR